MLVAQLYLTLCNPMDCNPPGFSIHWNFPGKNTIVGWHSLLQEIFLTQRLNLGLLLCRQILYCLSHQGSPILPWLGDEIEVLTWTWLYFSMLEIRPFLSVKVIWQLRDFFQDIFKDREERANTSEETVVSRKECYFSLCIQLIQPRKQLLVELSLPSPNDININSLLPHKVL